MMSAESCMIMKIWEFSDGVLGGYSSLVTTYENGT